MGQRDYWPGVIHEASVVTSAPPPGSVTHALANADTTECSKFAAPD